ncbi:MAG: heterodisulfide reductase-related iron-sulfur binding cluster [Bryobacteraceae bacterium]
MAASSPLAVLADKANGPKQSDLDKCVHCGLCLNACPTYRELGVEMDSPRGRIYQIAQVVDGAPITDAYVEHISLCLGCRGCETACPSGVPYGRLIEAARAQLESQQKRPLLNRLFRAFIFDHFIPSRNMLQIAGAGLYLYQASGMQRVLRALGVLNAFGNLGNLEALTPSAEVPFFFPQIGKTFAAEGERRFRVAFLAGCIANVAFARLNEATIRVLQKNGCEVVIPADQNCCGALAIHSGLKENARQLARRNIDAVLSEEYDAIITNAAGCGSTLKEYHELLEDDSAYHEKAKRFVGLMKDITEFLASIELRPGMRALDTVVTYQDSCHLAHGQKITAAPRKLLRSVPGVTFYEMPTADVCCGSAGIYNIVHNELAMSLLKDKMAIVNSSAAQIIVTANPGCMLQLRAGSCLYGRGQRVMHVVELLDEAYSKPVA